MASMFFSVVENVAGQHHRAHSLGDFAVAYHIGFAGGEGEHLHAGRAAVPVLNINAFFDIGDHVVEVVPGFDVGVGHADDRREAVADGAGVAGGFFVHLGGRFAGMQPADQVAFADQIGLDGARALIVVFKAAAQSGTGRAIDDVKLRRRRIPCPASSVRACSDFHRQNRTRKDARKPHGQRPRPG